MSEPIAVSEEADPRSALAAVAAKIDSVIRSDVFPQYAVPEELNDAVYDYPARGGKRLRPALVLWSCALLGGDPEKAVPAAAAVEIFHNWTLVHDDIIDCDSLRRGQPTCHTKLAAYARKAFAADGVRAEKFGSDFAILAGDIQQAWASDMLLRLEQTGVRPAVVLSLARGMAELNRNLVSGEALDVEFEFKPLDFVNEEDVLRMIDGKTSALLRYSVRCGAAVALGSDESALPERIALDDFARSLGLAFQLQDDLLGIFGTEESFGKPIGSDFQERKPTILYLEAKKRLSPEGAARLDSLCGLASYTPEIIAEIRSLLNSSGAENAVRGRADVLTKHALSALARLPENRWNALLRRLTEQLLVRQV